MKSNKSWRQYEVRFYIFKQFKLKRSLDRESEIVKNEKPFKILDNEQNDVTINFLLGAKKALDTCKNENILVKGFKV